MPRTSASLSAVFSHGSESKVPTCNFAVHSNDRLSHKADMLNALAHVRFWGQSGHQGGTRDRGVGPRKCTGRDLRRGKRTECVVVVPLRVELPFWPEGAKQLGRFEIVNDN